MTPGKAAGKRTHEIVSNLLHDTPWWLLLTVAMAVLMALALFTVPLGVITWTESRLVSAGEARINTEIDSAFSESALNIGRSVLKEMLERTKDPERRGELERALGEIESARDSMREAGKK